MTTKAKFAAINLEKRANVKATEHGLVGIEREVFVFIAVSAGVGFNTLMRRFDSVEIGLWVGAMKTLMDSGLLFQMYSSDRYYTVAI